MATQKGVWDLQDVRDKQLQSAWDYVGNVGGTIYSWGANQYGRLGQNNPTPTQRKYPAFALSGSTWTDMMGGVMEANFTGATREDGTLWMWGRNYAGQLGQNNKTDRSSPVQIPGTDWSMRSDANFANDRLKMVCGQGHTMAVKTDGTLWAWGNNANGQLAQNDTIKRSSPVQIGTETTWKYVTRIKDSCAYGLKTDGTIWGWGYNQGYLGNGGGSTQYSSPVMVGGSGYETLGGQAGQSVMALKSGGELWIWGPGTSGQLGQNDRANATVPVQIPGVWSIAAATGDDQAYAMKGDGSLWSWGVNEQGQLGLNTSGPSGRVSSPTQIPGTWTTAVWIAGHYGMVATKPDGTMWSWGGPNSEYQLGQNNTTARSSPTQTPGTGWNSKITPLYNGAMAMKT